MPPLVKKILQWIFWIFVIYAIFTNPDKAADIIKTVWDIIVNGLSSIGIFFDRILAR